jgi:hypothetical protein
VKALVALVLVSLWLCVASGVRAAEPGDPRILHVPAQDRIPEQGILTPIPIALDLPDGLGAGRVLVHYKLFGADDWVTLELRRESETRFAGAIPCLEVSTVTGDVLYYVRVHAPDGEVVAYSGTRHDPFRVRIVRPAASAQDSAGGRCPDPADCPLGLPGCPSAPVERIPCESNDDCEGESRCGWEGFCEDIERSYVSVTLEAQQEFGLFDTTAGCTVSSQETEGYACYRERDDLQYLGRPTFTREPLGLGVAATRVLVGGDLLVSEHATLGLRAGYAVRGEGRAPPLAVPYLPYLAELRVGYWFGQDPFARAGFRYTVFGALGAARFDVPGALHVRANPTEFDDQGGNDLDQTVRVWKRAGDGFVGVGAGAAYAVSRSTAFGLELMVLQVFPFEATIIAPRLGLRVGL